MIRSSLFLVLMLITGCGRSVPSTPPTKLDFDPGLTLKWPVKPSESGQVIETNNGVMKTYSAMASEKFPDGLLIYLVSVKEFPDEKFDGHTPQQMLEFHNFAFKERETSRTIIEHGPKKYPGLEIKAFQDAADRKRWDRKINVMAGRRMYTISVSASRNEKLLDRPEVKAFFESFEIKE